ncbi:hypothetical protein F4809DRAFT_583756 [Biscogniauxia mediterranea]|nr:hypothetical protein F4809DRAFT_583756 [Biscogniauxia mediterranea]
MENCTKIVFTSLTEEEEEEEEEEDEEKEEESFVYTVLHHTWNSIACSVGPLFTALVMGYHCIILGSTTTPCISRLFTMHGDILISFVSLLNSGFPKYFCACCRNRREPV